MTINIWLSPGILVLLTPSIELKNNEVFSQSHPMHCFLWESSLQSVLKKNVMAIAMVGRHDMIDDVIVSAMSYVSRYFVLDL